METKPIDILKDIESLLKYSEKTLESEEVLNFISKDTGNEG